MIHWSLGGWRNLTNIRCIIENRHGPPCVTQTACNTPNLSVTCLSVSEFRNVEIEAGPMKIRIWLLDEASKTEWDGLWPTATRPANTSLFTLNDVMYWWSVDLSIHPFARNFEGLLESTRCTLLWGLPSLTHMLINTDKLATSGQLLTLFKSVQVYSRLSIAYRSWNVGRSRVQEVRPYINQAFRVTLDASELASKQIEQLDKNHSSITSFLPYKKPRENMYNANKRKPYNNQPTNFRNRHQNSNTSTNNQNSGKWNKPSKFGPKKGVDPKAKLCFNCGKAGHLARNCRLKGKNNNTEQ